MAGQAEKRGLPPQLPLMASLVESGMKNLNFGDADSVGFFQMRVGIWNQGAYAGYPEKPELQVKWFLDQAEAVKRQRLVAGKSITDPNQFGEWIADVERPAAQFRGRYQTKLEEANGLLAQAPAQPAAAPAAAAAAAPVDPAAAAAGAAALGDAKLPAEILAPVQQAIAAGNAPGPKALAAIQEASKYIGTDYKWGGSTPQTGFDCSGLMQWAYAQSGVQIPRVTYTQIEARQRHRGRRPREPQARRPRVLRQRGDVHHVGMFLGGDKFLHAPHTGDVVKVSSLSEPYYASQFAGGRRFDDAAGVAAVPAAAPAAAPVAAAAAAAPAAPAIDPTEVAKAQAAVARDAAEVRRNDSQLFQAIKAVESSKEREKQCLDDVPEGGRPLAGQAPAEAAAAGRPRRSPAARRRSSRPRRRGRRARRPPRRPRRRPPCRRRRRTRRQPRRRARRDRPHQRRHRLPGRQRLPGRARQVAGQAGRRRRPPAGAPGDGLAGRVRRQEPQLRRRRLRRLLPDARRDLEQGRVRRLPGEARAAGQVVHRPGARRQEAARGGGQAASVTDPNQFGEWIADVERPAAQFRGRYQLRLGEARKLLK